MEQHNYKNSWSFKGKKVIECEDCGYKHLYPKPTQEELDDFYVNQYYSQIKHFNYEAVDDDLIATRSERIKDSIIYNQIYKVVTEHIDSKEKTMLDLGCGNNLLSVFFKHKGWDSYVIEPNKDSFKYISRYGVKGYNCFFENIKDCDLPLFSYINVDYVIEHFMNPDGILSTVNGLLRDDGLLRLVMPNEFSEGHLAYMEYQQKEPSWICYPDHISYFNIKEVERLAKAHGFEIVYRTTNFPLELLLLFGIDYYSSSEDKARVSDIVKSFEHSFFKTGRKDVLFGFYEKIAEAGFGRKIDLLLKKNNTNK